MPLVDPRQFWCNLLPTYPEGKNQRGERDEVGEILIADDHRAVRILLRNILETVPDGRSAAKPRRNSAGSAVRAAFIQNNRYGCCHAWNKRTGCHAPGPQIQPPSPGNSDDTA